MYLSIQFYNCFPYSRKSVETFQYFQKFQKNSKEVQFYFHNNFFTGRCHEEIFGRGLRSCGQPHLLQPEYRHVARRCQEILRRPSGQAQGPLQTIKRI